MTKEQLRLLTVLIQYLRETDPRDMDSGIMEEWAKAIEARFCINVYEIGGKTPRNGVQP